MEFKSLPIGKNAIVDDDNEVAHITEHCLAGADILVKKVHDGEVYCISKQSLDIANNETIKLLIRPVEGFDLATYFKFIRATRRRLCTRLLYK